jgi:hypothetical protein
MTPSGHDDLIDQAQQQRGARHARARHREHGWDHAGGLGQSPRNPSPRVQAHHTLSQLGARRVEHADDRYTELGRGPDERLGRVPAGLTDGAVVLPARDAEPADGAAIDLPQGCRDRVALPARDKNTLLGRAEQCCHAGPMMRLAL